MVSRVADSIRRGLDEAIAFVEGKADASRYRGAVIMDFTDGRNGREQDLSEAPGAVIMDFTDGRNGREQDLSEAPGAVIMDFTDGRNTV